MLKPKILLIENDRPLVASLRSVLADEFTVVALYKGIYGAAAVEKQSYDLVILDLHLDDLPGMTVCEKIRKINREIPILILTGDNMLERKVNLFAAGADDYLVKPFHLKELVARLNSLLRRRGDHNRPNSIISYGGVALDSTSHEVTRDGQLLALRRKEFDILECLLLYAEKVVTRETLMEYAWNDRNPVWTNALDVHIKYLRDKLDGPFEPPLLHTVRGLGYKLSTKLPLTYS